MIKKLITAATLSAALTFTASAQANKVYPCSSKKCFERMEWKRYKASPLPACTYVNESGPIIFANGMGPYGWKRYKVTNRDSSASGKYQIMNYTWFNFGGRHTAETYHVAASARPIEQERMARKIIAAQGIRAWHGCW